MGGIKTHGWDGNGNGAGRRERAIQRKGTRDETRQSTKSSSKRQHDTTRRRQDTQTRPGDEGADGRAGLPQWSQPGGVSEEKKREE